MDTNSLQIIVIIVIVILTCIYVYVRNKKNAAAAIERRITKEWGNIPSKNILLTVIPIYLIIFATVPVFRLMLLMT